MLVEQSGCPFFSSWMEIAEESPMISNGKHA